MHPTVGLKRAARAVANAFTASMAVSFSGLLQRVRLPSLIHNNQLVRYSHRKLVHERVTEEPDIVPNTRLDFKRNLSG